MDFNIQNIGMKFLKCLLAVFFIILIIIPSWAQNSKYENEKYILVMDVQQAWTESTLSKKECSQMIKSINSIIEKSNPEKIIYITSEVNLKFLSVSWKGIKTKTLSNNNFDEKLLLVNQQIIDKKSANAFESEELLELLNKNNVSDVLVIGLLAEECVTETVKGGLEKDFKIFISSKAIGGKSKRSKQKALNTLLELGAQELTF